MEHIESISQIVLVVQQIGGDMTKQTQEPNVVLLTYQCQGGNESRSKVGQFQPPKLTGLTGTCCCGVPYLVYTGLINHRLSV